jgi:hypothetical protein
MGGCPFSENHVNVWDAEVEMESMIGDVPWGVGHGSEKFRLVSLNDSYVGLSSTSPQFYSVCPHWFEHCFVDEKFIS